MRGFGWGATALGIVLASPALAQTVPAETTDGGLEEIVVTAQKREENLQDVPVSVTAIGEAAIANSRINEFSDLTRVASSLTITQQVTSPNNSIILRGIGTFAFSTGVEPSVAVIVDDLPVVQQAQAFDGLSDIARIEVLKGPQGTLFGKSASAGVVNIVTKDPDDVLSGRAQFTATTDSDYRVEGGLSVPFGGNGSGARLSGYYRNYRGNVRNLTTGNLINDQEAFGFRGKLKLVASDRVDFTLAASYAESLQDGSNSTIRSITPASTPRAFGVPLLPSLVGIVPGRGNTNARFDSPADTSNKTFTISGKAVIDLGSVDLISVTGFQDWKFDFNSDADNTDLNILGALTGGVQSGGIRQSGPYHSKLFTQELRLVSSGNGPLKYLAGLYYADATTDRAFVRGPVQLLANWDATNTTESMAAFGQFDYTLPTGTTISGGIRLNHEKIGVRFDNLLTPSAAQAANPALLNAGCFVANNPGCRGTNSDTVVTWKAVISQELGPQVMAYAGVAKGYKGFAYDVTSGFNPARIDGSLAGLVPGTATAISGVGPVKAETSTSYEIGLKSRFLDNKVQLNIVGYLGNYNNFQAQSSLFVNNALQFVLNNVGSLRTKGVEVEFQAKPSDWLRLDASAAYTDAKITSFPGAQPFSDQTGAIFTNGASTLVGNCVDAAAATAAAPRTLCRLQNRTGAGLPNAPKFKFNLAATGEFPFGDDNKAIVTMAYQHQSSVNFDLLGNPLLTEAGYGVFNTSIGAEFANGLKVTAFVNNLFDKQYTAFLSDGFGGLGGSATNPAHVIYQVVPRDSKRYFGVRVGYSF